MDAHPLAQQADAEAPIVATFHAPEDEGYQFADLSRRVKELGFILYPGKLTKTETFRVGCIGAIGRSDVRRAVEAIEVSLKRMGVLPACSCA